MNNRSFSELIRGINSNLRDFRRHEKDIPNITEKKIRQWITQFELKVRCPILLELYHILKRRYFSRSRTKKVMLEFIVELSRDFRFESTKSFLKNCKFLELQGKGKSQSDMLALLNEVLSEKFNLSLSQCGSKSQRYSIYIDDMLCTGNTLLNNVRSWCHGRFFKKKTNFEAVKDESTMLILFYLFFHQRGFEKRLTQIRHEFPGLARRIRIYREIEINNYGFSANDLDVIYPTKIKNRSIDKYREKINREVDEYIELTGYRNPIQRYYRNERRPLKERFFTSPEGRHLIEIAFLLKGIEILKTSNARKKNIRALGFSLPSERNFGFGALCFTWRNVSNNTPLVFWYSAGDFVPLFQKIDR